MRRALLALLVLPLALASACGGGDADSPLDDALGYLPADAPFAAAIDTDVDGAQFRAAGRLLDRFAFGEQVREALREQLRQGGAGAPSFERDVEPLLGNPFVVGSTDARAFVRQGAAEDPNFVGAIQVEDGDALTRLVEDGDARELGEANGATLYRDRDGDVFAVDDRVLVVAGSRRVLEAALARREQDDRMREDAFEQPLEGLPEQALVRAVADLEAILRADPDTRDARRVEWVRALRRLGLTAAAEDGGVGLELAVATDGELSDADLPIAAGSAAPDVVRQARQLSLGLRDPSQVVDFAQAAGRSIDPRGYAGFEDAKRQIRQGLRVDVDRDLLAQLRGDMSLNLTLDGGFGARAQLRDPALFRRTLERLAGALPRIAEGGGAGSVGLARPGPGEDFYALAQPDGDSVVFGVVDGELVVSNEPARAGRLASAAPTAVRGAEGALVMEGDAAQLANVLLRRAAPELGLGGAFGGALLTRPLGRLRGWVEASPSGLRGRAELEIE